MSTGKVALVTGGSRGTGAAIARRLAEDGLRVALTYATSPHRADEVVGEIERARGQALGLQADAADPNAVTAAVERTVAAYGSLDVLVSNAGVATVGALDELTPEQIDPPAEIPDIWVRKLAVVAPKGTIVVRVESNDPGGKERTRQVYDRVKSSMRVAS